MSGSLHWLIQKTRRTIHLLVQHINWTDKAISRKCYVLPNLDEI